MNNLRREDSNMISLCFLAFFLIFISELGDKTQLLVLSFSSKLKSYCILLGVALGSFFSHGVAILFGGALGNLHNPVIHTLLQFVTYLSFVFFGLLTLLKKEAPENTPSSEVGLLHRLSQLPLGYDLMIASSIAVGEFGDKTFLASLGLGISYPNAKLWLVLGAILGMVVSDGIAILFGKWLSHKFSENTMRILSGGLFLLFGIGGLVSFFMSLS